MQSRKGHAIRFMCCCFTSKRLFVSLLSLTLKSPAKISHVCVFESCRVLMLPANTGESKTQVTGHRYFLLRMQNANFRLLHLCSHSRIFSQVPENVKSSNLPRL